MRNLRRGAVIFVLTALALLLAWVGLDVWAGRRADAAFSRLQSRFGPLDGHSIASPRLTSSDNRARPVRAAAVLIGFPDSGLSQSLARFRQLPDSSAIPTEIRGFVDDTGEARRVAALALDRRESSWGADYAGGANVPSWLEVRALSNALYAAARTDIERGQPDDAARQIAAGLAVSASIRDEPSLIAQLIRIVVANEQCEAVKRLVAASEPSRAALQQLAQWLDESRRSDPVSVGLIAELRYGNLMFLSMEDGQETREFPPAPVLSWRRAGRLGRPVIRLARADYLRQMEQMIDRQFEPRPLRSLPPVPASRAWSWRRLSQEMMPGLRRFADTGEYFSTVISVTKLGVALRSYRLDHGTYPTDLPALVPVYLPRLPIDSSTGQPPVYARAGSGFTLKASAPGRSAADQAAVAWDVSR